MDLMKTGQFDINETEMYRVRGRTLQRCAVYVGLMCASDDVVQHSEQRIGLWSFINVSRNVTEDKEFINDINV